MSEDLWKLFILFVSFTVDNMASILRKHSQKVIILLSFQNRTVFNNMNYRFCFIVSIIKVLQQNRMFKCLAKTLQGRNMNDKEIRCRWVSFLEIFCENCSPIWKLHRSKLYDFPYKFLRNVELIYFLNYNFSWQTIRFTNKICNLPAFNSCMEWDNFHILVLKYAVLE